jgi:hypothetical protein
MSPTEKVKALTALEALQVRKAIVRARIAQRRRQGSAAVAELRVPLTLFERGREIWREIPGEAKWLAVPAGLLLAKKLAKRLGGPAALLSYAPLAIQVAQMIAAFRRRPQV